jgi:hypothetical protein
MSDEFLRRELRKFVPSSPSEVARARAKHRALLAFQNPGDTSATEFLPTFWRRAWAFAAVLVAVGLAAIVCRPRGGTENLADDRQMLRQIEQVFPHQLNAVVQKNGQVDLSLTETDEMGSDQPIVLLFKRENDVVRVLSFSGHYVCVPLGARKKCFEVLETTEGGIILESDKDVLIASRHPTIEGYAFRAQTLPL